MAGLTLITCASIYSYIIYTLAQYTHMCFDLFLLNIHTCKNFFQPYTLNQKSIIIIIWALGIGTGNEIKTAV